jgi:hypothetical protein
MEIYDTNIGNVLREREKEEVKHTFQKSKGEMLRQKMQKVEDP